MEYCAWEPVTRSPPLSSELYNVGILSYSIDLRQRLPDGRLGGDVSVRFTVNAKIEFYYVAAEAAGFVSDPSAIVMLLVI